MNEGGILMTTLKIKCRIARPGPICWPHLFLMRFNDAFHYNSSIRLQGDFYEYACSH